MSRRPHTDTAAASADEIDPAEILRQEVEHYEAAYARALAGLSAVAAGCVLVLGALHGFAWLAGITLQVAR